MAFFLHDDGGCYDKGTVDTRVQPRFRKEGADLTILDQEGEGKLEFISSELILRGAAPEEIVNFILAGAVFREDDDFAGQKLTATWVRKNLPVKKTIEVADSFIDRSLREEKMSPEDLNVCREFCGGLPGEDKFVRSYEVNRTLAGVEDLMTNSDFRNRDQILDAFKSVEEALFLRWGGEENAAKNGMTRNDFIFGLRGDGFGSKNINNLRPGKENYQRYFNRLKKFAIEMDVESAARAKTRSEVDVVSENPVRKSVGLRGKMAAALSGIFN